jgi:hypothetical protein
VGNSLGRSSGEGDDQTMVLDIGAPSSNLVSGIGSSLESSGSGALSYGGGETQGSS